jgi:membrane protein DedA with SNARE-associated domain
LWFLLFIIFAETGLFAGFFLPGDSLLFVAGIYSNMRSLEVANVDTVIVFRSACPLIVALGDWLFLGREAPSPPRISALARNCWPTRRSAPSI